MPSMVGQEGMPPPAPRPRGPKLKFTAEDDQLLILLKEQKNLTWKQIADFFPGRSSGTLQVRYCTKLKAKTTLWTEEMVSYQNRRGFICPFFFNLGSIILTTDKTIGSKTKACAARLRQRKMANCRAQSRFRIHTSCMSRTSCRNGPERRRRLPAATTAFTRRRDVGKWRAWDISRR